VWTKQIPGRMSLDLSSIRESWKSFSLSRDAERMNLTARVNAMQISQGSVPTPHIIGFVTHTFPRANGPQASYSARATVFLAADLTGTRISTNSRERNSNTARLR
jgi:hypothetical protein